MDSHPRPGLQARLDGNVILQAMRACDCVLLCAIWRADVVHGCSHGGSQPGSGYIVAAYSARLARIVLALVWPGRCGLGAPTSNFLETLVPRATGTGTDSEN